MKKLKKLLILLNLTMDKLLKADVFTKQHKFATKEDGMNFIKSNKDVMKFIDNSNVELEEVFDKKITEFNEFLNKEPIKYEKELAALESKNKAKERVAERKQKKEEVVKRDLREELKQELLMEIQKEKEELMKVKYEGFYPTVKVKEFDIDAYFYEQLKVDKISKEKLKKLKQLASAVDAQRTAMNNLISDMI